MTSDPAQNHPATEIEDTIIGTSKGLRNAIEATRRVGPRAVAVLIQGETGTGKERIAKLVHMRSRRTGRYLKVNCAAFTDDLLEAELFGHEKGAYTGAHGQRRGLFEQANGGTLFLDEAGEMSSGLQSKLLRVLQEGQLRRMGGERDINVDVRVVSATHQDLMNMSGFRRDLYFRLAGYRIALPPLRERGRDVIRIARHLLKGQTLAPGEEAGFAKWRLCRDAEQVLLGYRWPGNVRELDNVLTQVVVDAKGARIQARHVRAALPGDGGGEGAVLVDLDLVMLNAIETAGQISGHQLGEELRLSRSACRRRLRRLRDEGRIDVVGTGTATLYWVRRCALPAGKLDQREQVIFGLVTAHGQAGRDDVVEALGVSCRTANRLLGGLVECGRLEAVRVGRSVRYRPVGIPASRD